MDRIADIRNTWRRRPNFTLARYVQFVSLQSVAQRDAANQVHVRPDGAAPVSHSLIVYDYRFIYDSIVDLTKSRHPLHRRRVICEDVVVEEDVEHPQTASARAMPIEREIW